MFAGKTEELLRRVERARIAKKEVLVFKPEIDTRYSTEEVVTHHGRSFPSIIVPLVLTKKFMVTHFKEEIEKADVIAFDEAHFFKGRFVEVCRWLTAIGKRVIVAGLDLDFRAKPFGYMPELLALADEVLKLQAVCVKCGRPATRTQRMVNGKPARKSDPVILVGGLEKYEARCLDCYIPPK